MQAHHMLVPFQDPRAAGAGRARGEHAPPQTVHHVHHLDSALAMRILEKDGHLSLCLTEEEAQRLVRARPWRAAREAALKPQSARTPTRAGQRRLDAARL